MVKPEPKPKVWDYDQETLDQALEDYQKIPVADRRGMPFGRWFMHQFYMPQLIGWPALFHEPDEFKAFLMLQEMVQNPDQQ